MENCLSSGWPNWQENENYMLHFFLYTTDWRFYLNSITNTIMFCSSCLFKFFFFSFCFLKSPVSGQHTGAWFCLWLYPWKLLPCNWWPLGGSRDELKSFIHLWLTEERTLLHCQPSAGRADTSSYRPLHTHTIFVKILILLSWSFFFSFSTLDLI